MPYTAPTLTAAVAELASRLNDPLNIHWTAAELATYLREALRTWNAWTAHWREQASFATSLSVPFYDLPTELPTLRAYTVTNWEMVADLQYALMEPVAPPGTWTGTDQFTLAQLSGAIQSKRDTFLQQTGAVQTRTETVYAAPPASGRIDLDEAVLDVRRAAWLEAATFLLQPLIRTDEWAGTHYQRTWGTATQPPPSAYSVSATPPITMQVIPPPLGAGTLDMVAIHAGPTIDPLVEAVLGIPDDFAWVVKYGALSELLNYDALALDPSRAAYCQQRWEMGLAQARSAAVVLNAQINDVPALQGGLNDTDMFSPLWQLVPGVPETVLTVGQNMLALAPPPGGGGPYTISLDVVRNAPVPTAGGDILQISQDLYDTILDIAQHTALFKQGPGELEMAMGLLDRAAGDAGIDLKRQQAQYPDRAAAFGQTQQDRRYIPEQRQPVPIPVEG